MLSIDYVNAIIKIVIIRHGFNLSNFIRFYELQRLINWKTWTASFSTTKRHSHLFYTEWLFDKHDISKIKVKSDPKDPNTDEK